MSAAQQSVEVNTTAAGSDNEDSESAREQRSTLRAITLLVGVSYSKGNRKHVEPAAVLPLLP